jgi:hypothetical protein
LEINALKTTILAVSILRKNEMNEKGMQVVSRFLLVLLQQLGTLSCKESWFPFVLIQVMPEKNHNSDVESSAQRVES